MYDKNKQLLEAVKHDHVIQARWLIGQGASEFGRALLVAHERKSYKCEELLINKIIGRNTNAA